MRVASLGHKCFSQRTPSNTPDHSLPISYISSHGCSSEAQLHWIFHAMSECHPPADSLEPERMGSGRGRVRDSHKIDDQRIWHTSNGVGAGNIFLIYICSKISSTHCLLNFQDVTSNDKQYRMKTESVEEQFHLDIGFTDSFFKPTSPKIHDTVNWSTSMIIIHYTL